MKTWEELLTESKKHAQQSKPEKLAIIDILVDNPSSISDIHNSFISNYNSDISQNQIRYNVKSLIEDNLISERSGNKNEKIYYIIDPTDNLVSPISKYQAYLLLVITLMYLYTQYIGLFLLFSGIVLSITLHQLEYQYSLKDYSNYIKFKVLNRFIIDKSKNT